MQNVSKSGLQGQSERQIASLGNRAIETTGDLRTFLSRIAVAVAQGDMKVNEAAVAVKACEQINASLYSEIKSAAMQLEAGRAAPQLGQMQIGDKDA